MIYQKFITHNELIVLTSCDIKVDRVTIFFSNLVPRKETIIKFVLKIYVEYYK